MKNLAEKQDCDIQIEQELVRSRIEIVRGERMGGEIPASITGKLRSFTFRRAWYYWVVKGNVPLDVAKELYKDPIGKMDIRVHGHCMCPSPEEWAIWIDKDGKECISTKEHKEISTSGSRLALLFRFDEYRASDDPANDGFSAFITHYHIDTEVGLRLFVDTLRKYNLV